METIAKTEEQLRQERAVAWAKRMLASKRELEKKMDDDVKNNPKVRELVSQIRKM
ncbi:hypothetical protein P1X15_02480 [Runella sp. MFBS21]|jgi:hypothetical protein|uniref:hypothetical protein n=1 Tax=Runella TaxID=105 RepID=UPI0003F88B12|nr:MULTISPECIES: hypothetical protein [Runella]MDF7816436.1 hypothetical protein [Runella sp. MFBS21]